MITAKEMQELPHDYSVLINQGPGANLHKYDVLASPQHAILLSLTRTAENVNRILTQRKVKPHSLHIIDGISMDINAPREEKNTHYLPSARHLTEASLAVENALKQAPKTKKTLIVDSVAALSKLHGPETAAGFIKYINARAKAHNTQVILLSEHKYNQVNNKLRSVIDKMY